MKNICVITGSRAEYGLLYWLLKEIDGDPDLELQLVVTGMHLEPRFGNTLDVIEKDGFRIVAQVPMDIADDQQFTITKSIGRGIIGMTDVLVTLSPDCIVVLGDRFEILAAVQSALFNRIPIVHIHGGELSEGAIDDSIRHAITKLAHLHFVAAETYRDRVVRMGEQPDRVFNIGAMGLEAIRRSQLSTKSELEKAQDFYLGEKFFLMTYHPETLSASNQPGVVSNTFRALDEFPEYSVLVTGANADAGNTEINNMIRETADNSSGRIIYRKSLGSKNYLSAMSLCSAVIGNSSSGIVEAPVFGIPTINIGNRQKGRLRVKSIIDCGESSMAIADALKCGISKNFLRQIKGQDTHYGSGDASRNIVQILKSVDLDALVTKSFYDAAN